MLEGERWPFRRTRSTWKAIRLLKSGGGDFIRMIKTAPDAEPAWLQPPERAMYPVLGGGGRYTAIELDRAALDWVERVRTVAPRRVGPIVLIDGILTF